MTNTRQARAHRGGRIAVGVLLIVISLFSFLSTVGAFGFVGKAVYGFWVGFFGLAAYAYTLGGVIIGIAVTFGIRPRMRFVRALMYFGLLFFAILALHVYTSSGYVLGSGYGDYLHACYQNTNTAGGMLFGLVAFPIMKAITSVGALVIACVAFFILALIAIFPSIRKNVTYTAPSQKERRAPRKAARRERNSESSDGGRNDRRSAHPIEATASPVITDLSQARQGGLYVVDVDGDPMPQKRGKKAKGADGYQPLGSFDPLYPNRNGGYEDEVISSPRAEAVKYSGLNAQDMAKDILFGESPNEEIISRYNTVSRARSDALANVSPSYSAVRRNEMRMKLGVDEAQDAVREEYMSRFRAPRQSAVESETFMRGQNSQTQAAALPTVAEQASVQPEQPPVKHDFFSLKEEQDRLFSLSGQNDYMNMAGGQIKKEVVKPTKVLSPLNDEDINPTVRKAEEAVSGEVNVGVLGALNRARTGEEPQRPAVKEEMTSVAYDRPQVSAPHITQNSKPRTDGGENKGSATVMRNGQPTSISELEAGGYTPVQDETKVPRAFAATYVEKKSAAPSQSANANQIRGYEMSKATLENPRPAYVDQNPTQGGAMPSEPAPVRQQVTGGEMSRAAIQGTTDIAGQSGKEKESAEMQARIQNIRKNIKETPNLGQYDRQMREEKVRSSQKRGLQDDKKPNGDAVKKTGAPNMAQVTVEEAIEKTKPRRPYCAPPVSLLEPPAPEVDQNEDYELKKDRILRTLASFNITGEVIEIKVGPTFTMYKLRVEMPRGRTINYISSLENDIAMKIEAESVRIIAPIPGEDAIGIEVPNKHRRNVNLSEIIESPEFNRAKDPATFALGKNLYGECCLAEVRKLPHVLIAGATGAGKSCCINSLIVSLLYKASPDDLRLILVDPKRVELSVYAGIPHLLMDEIICDADKAIRALTWAVQEMNRRVKYFGEVGYRNIEDYNADVNVHGYDKMPRIVIVVDEFAELMSMGKRAVEDAVNSIARLARAAGIHLVLATQRPSVDVISGTIKNNFPSRVAFKVTSSFDSKTILDTIGADKLLGYGDMLFMTPGSINQRTQGAFISNNEVKRVVDFIKEHNDSYFDNNIKEAIFSDQSEDKSEGSSKERGKGKDNDSELPPELFKVLEIGIEMRESNKPISISYVQRKLGIGFNKAAGLIDRINEMGYISDADDMKKRYVNISYEELDELRKSAEAEDEEE